MLLGAGIDRVFAIISILPSPANCASLVAGSLAMPANQTQMPHLWRGKVGRLTACRGNFLRLHCVIKGNWRDAVASVAPRISRQFQPSLFQLHPTLCHPRTKEFAGQLVAFVRSDVRRFLRRLSHHAAGTAEAVDAAGL